VDSAEEQLRRGNPTVAAAVAAAVADIPPATDPASYNSPPGEYALWASAGAVASVLGLVSWFVSMLYEVQVMPLVCAYFVLFALVSTLGFLLGPAHR